MVQACEGDFSVLPSHPKRVCFLERCASTTHAEYVNAKPWVSSKVGTGELLLSNPFPSLVGLPLENLVFLSPFLGYLCPWGHPIEVSVGSWPFLGAGRSGEDPSLLRISLLDRSVLQVGRAGWPSSSHRPSIACPEQKRCRERGSKPPLACLSSTWRPGGSSLRAWLKSPSISSL